MKDCVVEELVGRVWRDRRGRRRLGDRQSGNGHDERSDRQKGPHAVSIHGFSPRSRLENELETKDPAPERAVRDRTTFRVRDMFPDGIDLQFEEPVERPVDAQREGPLTAR